MVEFLRDLFAGTRTGGVVTSAVDYNLDGTATMRVRLTNDEVFVFEIRKDK